MGTRNAASYGYMAPETSTGAPGWKSNERSDSSILKRNGTRIPYIMKAKNVVLKRVSGER